MRMISRPCLLLLLLGTLTFSSFCFGQTTVHSLYFGGLNRSYRLHLPTNYTGATAVPLVFNLHGYTSNAIQQELYSEMNAVADTAGFIVVYPDGVNNSWNSGFSLPYYGGVDDVGFISALIDLLDAQYHIDLTRVYSCGMSNGGFMSYRLACDLETRIAAIASVTGSMTTIQQANCNCSRSMPVLEIHGTADATVPYAGGGGMMSIDNVVSYWQGHDNCQAPVVLDTLPDISTSDNSTVTSQWFPACDSSSEVAHFKIEGGGHTWPGATYLIPGQVTNQDMEASSEIWKFFSRFSHPGVLATAMDGPGGPVGPVVFPNPLVLGRGAALLRIHRADLGSDLRLMDMQGHMVASGTATGDMSTIEVQDLSEGIYLLQIIGSDRQTCHRVVVQR